jgi:hypothetical protein
MEIRLCFEDGSWGELAESPVKLFLDWLEILNLWNPGLEKRDYSRRGSAALTM